MHVGRYPPEAEGVWRPRREVPLANPLTPLFRRRPRFGIRGGAGESGGTKSEQEQSSSTTLVVGGLFLTSARTAWWFWTRALRPICFATKSNSGPQGQPEDVDGRVVCEMEKVRSGGGDGEGVDGLPGGPNW